MPPAEAAIAQEIHRKLEEKLLVDIETTMTKINEAGTQFIAPSVASLSNHDNPGLFNPAALVAISRSIATLATLPTIGDVLEEAVQALVRVGVESAMVVLHRPGKGAVEDSADSPIIYRECGSANEQFRYLVGSYFHKYNTGKPPAPILNQPPYFGWTITRLSNGYAYTVPIFGDDKPCGVLAFSPKPEPKIGSDYDYELLAGLALAVGANVTRLQMMEATRHNAEELRVMYEVAAIMAGATLDLKMLLRQTILIASRVVRASAATLMLLDTRSDELIFEVPVGGGGEVLNEFRMPVSQGIGGYVVREGQPVLVNDVASDPRWSAAADYASGYATHSVLCVPMQVHGRTIGALEVLNKIDAEGHVGRFTSEDAALLSAIATQAAAAIENAQLYQSLLQERDRIISTEEEVRRSFSRDLHDGPAQGLAALIMRIDLLKRTVSEDEARREIDALQNLAKRTNTEIRAMLSQLRPIVLETRGLIAAISEFVITNQGDAGVSYHFSSQPELDCSALSDSAQAAVYIIIQEAVNNIKKHAHANNVWIEMSEQIVRFNYTRSGKLRSTALLNNAPQRSLVIEVRDDGDGFDTVKVLGSYSELGSYGLLNMRERAELLNGDLGIVSAVQQGTCVTVRVPFPEPKS